MAGAAETRMIWVRHGPTHAKAMIGWTDLPADLSDRAALARLSALLPDAPVISSDLGRAVATADALQGTRPRLPHDSRLREIHFGTWEARTHDEVAAIDPTPLRAFWEDAGPIPAPGGESWDDLSARINAATDALQGHGTVIVVAHFGAILAALQRALGVGVQQVFAHRIEPMSLTEITRGPKGWHVGRINHLP
jgi:alpha-ribazole phosphatase